MVNHQLFMINLVVVYSLDLPLYLYFWDVHRFKDCLTVSTPSFEPDTSHMFMTCRNTQGRLSQLTPEVMVSIPIHWSWRWVGILINKLCIHATRLTITNQYEPSISSRYEPISTNIKHSYVTSTIVNFYEPLLTTIITPPGFQPPGF